jgi:nicotinic acetylcholine receptor
MSPDVLSALQGVRFIAQHIKDADKDNEVSASLWFIQNFHLDY